MPRFDKISLSCYHVFMSESQEFTELSKSDLEIISGLADLLYSGGANEDVIRQLAELPEGSGVELMFQLTDKFAPGDPTPIVLAGGLIDETAKNFLSAAEPGNK